ncbi:Dna2/Cas4 domain-containing protein [Thermococcus peptonophilus]
MGGDNLMEERVRITGVMVQYYFACRRELWFFSRGLNFDFDNDDMLIGRMIHAMPTSGTGGRFSLRGGEARRREEERWPPGDRGEEELKARGTCEMAAEILPLPPPEGRDEGQGLVSYPREGTAEEVELTEDDVETLENAFRGESKRLFPLRAHLEPKESLTVKDVPIETSAGCELWSGKSWSSL